MPRIANKRPKFFSERVYERRVLLGFTMRHLSKKINKSPSAVYKWESGATRPTAPSLAKLSKALHVKPDYFFGPPLENGGIA